MRPMGFRQYRLVIFTLAVLIMFSSALLPAAYCQSSLPGQGEGPPVNISERPSFSDLSGDEPNISVINYLARRGLIKGYPDGTYRPLEGLTRAQAAVMLVQLVKDPGSNKGVDFSDVPGFHWAAAGIRKAASAGLVSGYPDGTFRPDQTLTRAEGIALTLCLSKQPNRGVSLLSLKDVSPDHWAALPISTGLASGMVTSAGDAGEFRPDAPFTRGDMAHALAILLIKDINHAQSALPIELEVEKGMVSVSRSGVSSLVKDTASIIPGDTISTGAESSACLYFTDGSGIRLEQDTELVVNETRGFSYIISGGNPGTAVDWLSLRLTKGELFGALASSYEKNPELPAIEGKQLSRSRLHHNLLASLILPPGKLLADADNNGNDGLAWWEQAGAERVRVQVDMPWGVAGIRGTIWHSLVTPSENTTSVLTGKVDITAKSSTVPVLAGQACQSIPGQAPSNPVDMSAQERQRWINVLSWINKVIKQMETTRRDPLIYKDLLSPGEILNKITLPELNQNTQTGGGGSSSSNIESGENLPAVIAAPEGGLYSTFPLVTLDFPVDIKVYFTTDGANPTTNSNLYTGPISISSTTTLKYISVDQNGNQSSVYVEKYEIDTTMPSAAATPAGGPYNTGSPVTLSASEPAAIYYTTDLTNPTVNSSLYTDPINVTANTTLKFMVVDLAGNQSPVYTEIYTIDTTVPTVGATPLGGIYSSNQTVTLSESEQTTIYYTTDGADPTGQSAVYTSPISIAVNTILKFMAVDPAGNQSPTYTETYIIDTTPSTASASPAGGAYNTGSPVALSASEQATIYYTTNGSDPTGQSTVYTAPINVTANTTLKFMAVDLAGNQSPVYTETYNIDTTTPTAEASPPGGIYNTDKLVALAASEPAVIHYTTNGTVPTGQSSVYTSPISITANTTLKFMAVDLAGNQSPVNTETYVIDTTAPTAGASPAGGTYNASSPVTLTASEQATIYYTANGSDPTGQSAVYTAPINVTANTTLKFMAVDLAGNQSPVYTEIYTIDTTVPTVGATPPGGIYSSDQTVTLASSEPATIYYTTDGSDPTDQSAVYTVPISVAANKTLKFIAVDLAGNQSPVYTETYVIDTIAPTAEASPAGGAYNASSPVTLTASEQATIYYTTDGADPTGQSAVYTGPINITANTTLKFMAVDLAGNQSPVYTETYVIDTTVPTVEANPAGGLYNSGVLVTLTASEPAEIFYTTDGTSPAENGTRVQYTGAISINSTRTLKYLAVDQAGNESPVYSEKYTIWTIETIGTAVTGKVGGSTSISLDSAGKKHIAYYDELYSQLKYVHDDGSGWHSETVEFLNKAGSYTSLALDRGSRPHISYYEDISQDLKYAYRDNSGWHISTVDSENNVGSYSALALDSANRPHISYYDSTNIKGKTKILKEDLKYACWNGSSWLIEIVDSSGNVGSYTSIAVDTAGYPHISYYDHTKQSLKYAYKNASGWHTSTVDSLSNVGMYSSIALDRSGRPHISYYNATAKTLKYAFLDNSNTWRCVTVDKSNNVGVDTSIALDQQGRPHISYYDSAHKNLKYAYKDGDGAWYTVIVDSSGNSGLDTCIALDSSGRPYISFFNDTAKVLNCAHQ
ncbi:MAG: chitobiase/beta-hexosaminidase C-terminal domain-containing protein [Firmicutes bacterium]|nr:chitobiase/beta-hexosaminidase C-terminal domain-containing protein [Bacillota bacterium]